MRSLSEWFDNSAEIQRAIEDNPDVPVALICAVIRKEGSGRNVYGNDTGGVFSTPGAPDKDVTHDNFHNEFLPRVLAGEVSNGVGPMQITFAGRKDPVTGRRPGGFFKEAADQGLDLSKVYDNVKFGIGKIRQYLKDAGGVPTEAAVKAVGKRYNGATAYGDALWDEYKIWVDRLSNTTGGDMAYITLHGKRACSCQQKTLPYLERDLRAAGLIIKDLSGLITQQAYNSTVNASGSTHDGGGVWDVVHRLVDTDAKKKIWARNGWIPFDRRTIDAPRSKWPNHGHMVVAGCPHRDASAVKQEASARAGRNALANNGPFRGNPGPIITWAQAVARETSSPGLPNTGVTNPPKPHPTWDGKSFPGAHIFTIGASHPAITLLGQRLIAHGFERFYKEGPGPRFTAADKLATQAFQISRKWKNADGIPGPMTWTELMKAPPKPTTPITIIRRGATGETVRKLQDGLNRVFPAYSKLKEDGIFGYATERVVKEFQKRSNLKIDGIVGPVTKAALAKHNIKF